MFLLPILQMLGYFILIIFLVDRFHCESYKGMNNNIKRVNRNQLPEDQDVVQKKTDTAAIWDNHDYPIKAKKPS